MRKHDWRKKHQSLSEIGERGIGGGEEGRKIAVHSGKKELYEGNVAFPSYGISRRIFEGRWDLGLKAKYLRVERYMATLEMRYYRMVKARWLCVLKESKKGDIKKINILVFKEPCDLFVLVMLDAGDQHVYCWQWPGWEDILKARQCRETSGIGFGQWLGAFCSLNICLMPQDSVLNVCCLY